MKTLTHETLSHVARFLKALGEANRLKILRALHDGERTVSDIIAETGATQSNVSKHLAVLTAVGVVTCRSIAERIRQQRATLKNIEKGVTP